MKENYKMEYISERNLLTTHGIDLMHNDVTRFKGSMGVVVTHKSKMAASSA